MKIVGQVGVRHGRGTYTCEARVHALTQPEKNNATLCAANINYQLHHPQSIQASYHQVMVLASGMDRLQIAITAETFQTVRWFSLPKVESWLYMTDQTRRGIFIGWQLIVITM